MVTTLRTAPVRPAPGAVADHLAPLLELVFSGAPPVRFECWDGSAIGPDDPPATLRLRSPDALRRMLWAPDELGLGRAYVAGELDVEGDIVDGLGALEIAPPRGVRTRAHPAARRGGSRRRSTSSARRRRRRPRRRTSTVGATRSAATRRRSRTTTTSATTSTRSCSDRR